MIVIFDRQHYGKPDVLSANEAAVQRGLPGKAG